MTDSQTGQWPIHRQHSPLRKRILEESRLGAQEYRRKPQQKHYRAPDFPGTAAFDLKNGLSEVPCAKRKRTAPPQSPLPPILSDDEPALTEEQILKMSPDEYHTVIMRELDLIEQASRSNTLSPLPHPSVDNLFENRSDTLSVGAADLSPYHEICQSTSLSACGRNISEPSQPVLTSLHTLPSDAKPVTEPQLINEVKGIYAGLVMVEEKCLDIMHEQSRPSKQPSDRQWEALILLHRTLLQEHHDFFLAVQHPSASPALKLLAIKYAMPERMWRESMHQFLELSRRRSSNTEQSMTLFGELCAETLQKLTEDVPQLSHEWELIKDNLREYFIALHADGFNVLSSLIDRWGKEESAWTRLRKSHFRPMQGHFFGDDDLPDWFVKTHLPGGLWESLEEPDDGSFGGDSPQGMAQLLMTGWLQYGRKIATSFHVYCQVAIFLAGTIFTASLTS